MPPRRSLALRHPSREVPPAVEKKFEGGSTCFISDRRLRRIFSGCVFLRDCFLIPCPFTIFRLVVLCECHIGLFAPKILRLGATNRQKRRGGEWRFSQTRQRPDAPRESGAREPTRPTRSDEIMESPHAWGHPSGSGGGPPGADKERHPIAGPGRCLFAVRVPPKDLDQDVARCARRRAPSSRSRPIFFAYITRTRPSALLPPARVDATLRRRLRRAFSRSVAGEPAKERRRVGDRHRPPFPSPAQGHRQVDPAERSSGYTVLENEVGAVTFLGDGAPDPDAAPARAQVLRRPDAVILLVSPTLAVARVGEAFTAAREANAEPKARASPSKPSSAS